MTETRDISLGGRTFAVPPLPLRVNRVAYPLCRKLVAAALLDRCIAAQGVLDCTDDEFGDLVDLAFLAASSAEKELTRDAFEQLAVTPPELLDAFFLIRYQTGAWVQEAAAPDGGNMPGEAEGA